jgi:hypothetical protein
VGGFEKWWGVLSPAFNMFTRMQDARHAHIAEGKQANFNLAEMETWTKL